jgi:hypothetical protein
VEAISCIIEQILCHRNIQIGKLLRSFHFSSQGRSRLEVYPAKILTRRMVDLDRRLTLCFLSFWVLFFPRKRRKQLVSGRAGTARVATKYTGLRTKGSYGRESRGTDSFPRLTPAKSNKGYEWRIDPIDVTRLVQSRIRRTRGSPNPVFFNQENGCAANAQRARKRMRA